MVDVVGCKGMASRAVGRAAGAERDRWDVSTTRGATRVPTPFPREIGACLRCSGGSMDQVLVMEPPSTGRLRTAHAGVGRTGGDQRAPIGACIHGPR
jgi:hypothetical protein